MKNHSSQSLGARALLVSILVAGALPAMADAVPGMYWTHTGATGAVDPADVAAANLDSDVITNVGPAAGAVRVRYNVVAVDGLEAFPLSSNGFAFVVRYRDQGALSQVVARLWRVSIATGERTMIAELDSDNGGPQLFNFQTQEVEKCGIGFDFTRNTYYVGVHLIRRTQPGVLPGLPALAALQIKPISCVD